jgi:hypothetical protein
MSKAACMLVFVYAACAIGGSAQRTDDANGNPADAKQYHDAHNVTGDGPVQHDASVQHDAAMQQDAAQMGGGFCSDNTQCISTECCFVALCVPGTQVGTNLCFPS